MNGSPCGKMARRRNYPVALRRDMTQFALAPFLPRRSMSVHALPLRYRILPRSPGVLAAVVLAHAGVVAALLTAPRAPQPPEPPTPLFVRLIEPAVTPPAPVVTPPSPPQAPPPTPAPPPKQPPVLTATPPLPLPAAPAAPAAPAPNPPTPVAEPPRPEPAPAAAPVEAPVEAPRPPPPPPLVQPRFNADYLDNPKPPYPSISRRMGEEGEVRLRVLVDAAGNAQQVELERSSGYPRLDAAALETVKRWRFVPARQGEQTIPATVIVPIQFTLRN